MIPLPHRMLGERFDRAFDTDIRAKFFRGLQFDGPAGDPGWFGPDSAVWYVHSHFPTLAFGLACAAYIEGLDPSIHWMGVHHSRLIARDADGKPTGKIDQEGAAVRFGHSLSFFIGTAYGSTETAEKLARTVRSMHHTVKGTRPDGLPYDADDPAWLRWNYATVVWGIATSHERYHPKPLRGAELDRYYGEFVRVGHALGGTDLPTTKAETLDCLKEHLPKLAVTPGMAERTGPNLRDADTRLINGPFMDWAIRDCLPTWAARMVMHEKGSWLERRTRRGILWAALGGLGAASGPIQEFRDAQARVAQGTTVGRTDPEYVLGSDPARSREEVEALL